MNSFSDAAFPDVVEIGEQLKKFFLAERVVFVIVTSGAAHGQPEPNRRSGLDAIDHVFDEKFWGQGTALRILPVISIESRSENLEFGCIGKHVTGELFDGELIKRHVLMKSLNHPVPPGPIFAFRIILVTIGVGIAGGIEPAKSLAFGVVG